MPVQSRRQGDDLLVDNVDLKRAARNLLNKTRAPGWTPPSDLNQAMELMASCFGYANLLAANAQALKGPQAAERGAPVMPGEAARLPEPLVVVFEADGRFDDEAQRRAMERAGAVDAGKRLLTLDMSIFESITTLRQFRKLEKPDVVVCSNVELGVNSASSSELMHVMVNNPGIEFRLVMRTVSEAHKLFSTWVYQDNSPAISGFMEDRGDGNRTAHKTQPYDPSDTKNGRALVAYPQAFHELLRASRPGAAASPAVSVAEHAIVDRLMTSRRDGRQMMRIGVGLEELTARADALAAAGPDMARAALENATTHFIVTPGSAMGKSATFHPAPDTFPTDCGPNFDQRWKNLASVGFVECLSGAVMSSDIVAVIGRPGSGKSLLVNAMAKSMGGAVIDFRLKTWQEDFDRVRRAPPGLVFIEELYHHSEATEMEVAAFALAAKSTKTVFVFQRYDTLMLMLGRRGRDGKPLFNLARVLDLDKMALNTVYTQEPPNYEERERRFLASNLPLHWLTMSEELRLREFEDALRESLPGKQIPVILASEDITVQSIMNHAIDSGVIRTASVVNCAEKGVREALSNAMRRDPDFIVFDHADKVPSEPLGALVEKAINTGHRVCLRVSDPHWVGARGLDLGGRFQFGAGDLKAIGAGRLVDEH